MRQSHVRPYPVYRNRQIGTSNLGNRLAHHDASRRVLIGLTRAAQLYCHQPDRRRNTYKYAPSPRDMTRTALVIQWRVLLATGGSARQTLFSQKFSVLDIDDDNAWDDDDCTRLTNFA